MQKNIIYPIRSAQQQADLAKAEKIWQEIKDKTQKKTEKFQELVASAAQRAIDIRPRT